MCVTGSGIRGCWSRLRVFAQGSKCRKADSPFEISAPWRVAGLQGFKNHADSLPEEVNLKFGLASSHDTRRLSRTSWVADLMVEIWWCCATNELIQIECVRGVEDETKPPS